MTRVVLVLAVCGILTLVGVTSYAADATTGGSIQSYAADTALANGTIVQLGSSENDRVQPATKSNSQNMFGVTVDRSKLLITSSAGNDKNQAYVAVTGTYNVLVSTEGGPIKSGDYITISSVDGIGMKADTEVSTVLGRTAGNFDGKGAVLGQEKVHDQTSGKDQIVQIASIPVSIKIEHNPLTKSTKADVPDFLERLGQQIAEKKVSPIRIYLSMAITAISLITAIIVLYAGVRNSVISIGRNPMSKKSVFRALLEIILTAILVLVIGLFAVYLLLKL